MSHRLGCRQPRWRADDGVVLRISSFTDRAGEERRRRVPTAESTTRHTRRQPRGAAQDARRGWLRRHRSASGPPRARSPGPHAVYAVSVVRGVGVFGVVDELVVDGVEKK